jgi:hypothetical protein
MNIVGKLKTIKRKWIYIAAAIIVVALAGGVATKVCHERFEDKNGEHKGLNSYQTYYDLLYLENTNDLKISAEQAKVLVPLVEKLSTTVDKTALSDLESNIYKLLTPEQYYNLLNVGNNGSNGKNHEMFGRKRGGFEGGNKFGKGENEGNIMDGTIKDIVVKMLKDKIVK